VPRRGILRTSPVRNSQKFQLVENSSMPSWRPDQELKDPVSAVFWPWFGGVAFVLDLPTGQIATFSTGWFLYERSKI
jgi:hypothetical protein